MVVKLSPCRVRPLLGMVLASVILVMTAASASAAAATVFVASSLTDVIGELADGFRQETGLELIIVPGSSSTLARQILSGAPADAFISANRDYADEVANATGTEAWDLFGNSLSIIAPDSFDGEVSLKTLSAAVGDGRLAIGDPEHVPAGIYAKQALENAGLWDELSGRIAPAGDVRGAVSFVAHQATPFGIVYTTDGQVEGVKIVSGIDSDLHTPIRYWGVVTNADNKAADMFFSYIGSMKGENLIDYLGFDVGRDFDFLKDQSADE